MPDRWGVYVIHRADQVALGQTSPRVLDECVRKSASQHTFPACWAFGYATWELVATGGTREICYLRVLGYLKPLAANLSEPCDVLITFTD